MLDMCGLASPTCLRKLLQAQQFGNSDKDTPRPLCNDRANKLFCGHTCCCCKRSTLGEVNALICTSRQPFQDQLSDNPFEAKPCECKVQSMNLRITFSLNF
eukprot:1160009-Pelagomonas_calceolata.AAC.3